MRVTDSGLTGLHLGAMRVASGHLQLGLVVSWNQSSVSPLEDIGRMRAEPFFLRPIGLNFAIADGLFASAMAERHGITERAVAERVRLRLAAAAKNPRAVRRVVPELDVIAASPLVAHPLRSAHRAPVTDGAVAMVLASGDWVRAHPQSRPLARIAGAEWAVDRYQLDADRLAGLEIFRATLARVLKRPAILPVPALALKLLLGEMSCLFLSSQRALPQKALASGFAFEHPNLEEALRNLIGKRYTALKLK